LINKEKNMTNKHSGEIKFYHLGIGKALAQNRFVVPVNQREYAWKEKHVKDLLQDFSKAMGTNKETYFLGTIVLTEGKNGAPEVADGQQRLATTTILLAALRDYLYNKGEELLVQHIETEFLFKIVPKLKEISPRLTLNLDDNNFFTKRILSRPDSFNRNIEPTKDSHRKIENAAILAAKHIENILRPHSDHNKIAVINEWTEFVEETAKVIMLKVPDDLDAFVMFETLNDRGLRTSQTDLVKNYLFGEAEERLSEAQQKWSKMIGTLESLDIDDITLSYLRHLLSAMYGLTIDREIFERIKDKVKGRGHTISFLDILSERATDYVAILNPEHSKWNLYDQSIRKSIRTMNELQAVPLRHLMLSVAMMFEPQEAVKAFRLFISWAVRFLVTGGGRGGTLEDAYASSSHKIYTGEIKTTKQLADSLVKFIPSDAQFESDFAVAQVPKSKFARYLLRSLELKVKGNLEPEFVPNEDVVINLEHILPENPNPDWKNIDAETSRTYYRRLGNMVLLQASKNNAIGNKSFQSKVPIFRVSAYLLTSEVASNSNWGVEEIAKRQEKLAKLAVQTWSIDVN
jgi:uncharacterized protein with ParB-like and HNH nuclease domain